MSGEKPSKEDRAWELRRKIWKSLVPHYVDFSQVVNSIKRIRRHTVVQQFIHQMTLLEEEVRHAREDFDKEKLLQKIDELRNEVYTCVAGWDKEDGKEVPTPKILSIHSASEPSPNLPGTSSTQSLSGGASVAS